MFTQNNIRDSDISQRLRYYMNKKQENFSISFYSFIIYTV